MDERVVTINRLDEAARRLQMLVWIYDGGTNSQDELQGILDILNKIEKD